MPLKFLTFVLHSFKTKYCFNKKNLKKTSAETIKQLKSANFENTTCLDEHQT